VYKEIDARVKSALSDVFGAENDFDAIFRGVNVMAFDGDGNRVLANFMNAIRPLMEKAARLYRSEVNEYVGNREQRRSRNSARV
jgi:hypothetical protein